MEIPSSLGSSIRGVVFVFFFRARLVRLQSLTKDQGVLEGLGLLKMWHSGIFWESVYFFGGGGGYLSLQQEIHISFKRYDIQWIYQYQILWCLIEGREYSEKIKPTGFDMIESWNCAFSGGISPWKCRKSSYDPRCNKQGPNWVDIWMFNDFIRMSFLGLHDIQKNGDVDQRSLIFVHLEPISRCPGN